MTDIKFAAYGYPDPTQDATTGRWTVEQPDSVSGGDWGSFRIEAGATWSVGTAQGTAVIDTRGTDITTINDRPVTITSLSYGEPYGELTGSLDLPIAPFDDPAAIGVYPGGNIDIWRVLPAAEAVIAGTAEVPYWHGIVASLETADSAGITNAVSVQLMGALYGEASVRQHQPLMLDTSNDAGTWIGMALDFELYTRPFTPFSRFTFSSETTSIPLRYRGSRGQSTIDYLDEVLALAQNATAQWTISRAYQTLGGRTYPRARHYYVRAKGSSQATAPQQNTVVLGGYGVAVSLSTDVTTAENVIYGEGVHPVDSSDLSGSRWRNAAYPLLTTAAPANPSRAGTASTYPITIGDEDADFTADVVTQLTSQLRVSGWPDVVISSTFGTATSEAITYLKEDIGWANTTGNIGGTAEWAMVWGEGGTGFTDLESGFFQPLAWDTATQKYLYTADGDVSGTNPDYDPAVLRVERIIAYGDGVKKSRARTNARRIVHGTTAPTIGTITLTSDPTDEDGTGRSRLDIREGGWIQVTGLAGGTYQQFYIASVQQAPESDGFPTTLTVSTEPYDLLDLSTRIERNRAAKTDAAKSFYSQRTADVRPFRSAVGWDSEAGSGILAPFSAAGSAWEVKPFIGAQYGSIAALAVDAGTAVPFCFAVFGGSVSSAALGSAIPNPLGTVSGNYPSHWQHPDNADFLESVGFIEAWGSEGEAAGFYPGAQSAAGTPASSATGVLEDAGSWTFASLEPPYLWAAIWPQMAGTATGVSVAMRIVVEE